MIDDPCEKVDFHQTHVPSKNADMTLGVFRRLRRIAIGLFLTAQVAGVIPLISAHSSHEHLGAPIAQHSLDTADGSEIFHRSGQHQRSHGVDDECCVLHHGLVGSITPFFNASIDKAVRILVKGSVSTLAGGIALRLDRPPRFLR